MDLFTPGRVHLFFPSGGSQMITAHPFEVSDHRYLELADFLGQLFEETRGYPAWKQAEIWLGSTARGRELLVGQIIEGQGVRS